MSDYFKAPGEVRKLVKKIRSKYYHKFKRAKIVILMRTGNWDKYGTIGRVSKKQRQAGVDGDYILTLNSDEWGGLSSKAKRALIDHELYHMAKKKTRNGTKFALRHYDVEEFVDIVKRYGTWRESLAKMKEAMK